MKAQENWFDSGLGQWLLAAESEHCQNLVPAGYYPAALQIGMARKDFLAPIEIDQRYYVNLPSERVGSDAIAGMPDKKRDGHHVIAEPHALPFGDKTHSLIVMPHCLDFCKDPHQVLREVNQILIPEGCIVVMGFNQFGTWSPARLVNRLSKKQYHQSPWQGYNYSVRRVQDWLSLLGFDIVGAKMMAYQPPMQNEKWRNKLSFINQMGDRWFPGLGSVYMVVGKKREIASSSGVHRLAWRRFIPAIARPAVRSQSGFSATEHYAKHRLRLVINN